MQSVMGTTNAVSYNHVISDDGQFVAYEASTNSTSSGSPGGIILRYNLQSGLTDIVNTNAPGVASGTEAKARTLGMTPDGRFIAFVGRTNSSSCIYVWDAQSNTTTLVSGDLSNSVPTNSICDWPVVDPAGRFVAFVCSPNLTTNSLIGDYHLFMRDTQAGVTTLVDADTNGVGSGVSPTTFPRLSADAHFVAFEAPDGNLVPNDNNRDYDVFVRDLLGGTNELISAHVPALASQTPNAPSAISAFSVSMSGHVAFIGEADTLVANDTNGLRDGAARQLPTGTNFLVSVATNGMSGDGFSTDPTISADGRYLVFTSSANNLVNGDNNNARDVFLRDLQNGTTVLVSVTYFSNNSGGGDSYSPMISPDGRYVLFRSTAGDLVANFPFSGFENLFWRDTQSGITYALTATTSATN